MTLSGFTGRKRLSCALSSSLFLKSAPCGSREAQMTQRGLTSVVDVKVKTFVDTSPVCHPTLRIACIKGFVKPPALS